MSQHFPTMTQLYRMGCAPSPQCSAVTAQSPLLSSGDLAQGHWGHVLMNGLSPGEIVPVL